jgi:cysteine desulfurase
MEPVYLDHAATTPVRPEVRAAMDANLDDAFGNPSSAHRWGRKAAAALDRARARAAEALGARPSEILFVRGGTESDNLAVRGRWAAIRRREPHPLVVHTALEHPAVRETATALEAEGARREVLPVDRSGAPDLELLGRILSRSPAVVSMMWVNNEVGTVLPVPEAARLCAGAGVALHTDAVQAVGKIRVRVDEVPLALLTATGHKIGGPRGTGILFVREGTGRRTWPEPWEWPRPSPWRWRSRRMKPGVWARSATTWKGRCWRVSPASGYTVSAACGRPTS